MKKIITISLIALSLFFSAQPNVYVWRITPDTICPGDTIKIDYKPSPGWPTSPDGTTNNFYLNSLGSIWSGNWSILKSRPKEHYQGLNTGDSTYWIKVKTSNSLSIGSYTAYGTGTGPTLGKSFYVKNCACTITASYVYTLTEGVATFSSSTTGTNSATIFYWDFGIGSGYQALPPVVTFTYNVANTYNVKLRVENPLCNDEESKPITVTLTDVGIKEYYLDNEKPVFENIYGIKTDPQPGIFLIRLKGTDRIKTVISQ